MESHSNIWEDTGIRPDLRMNISALFSNIALKHSSRTNKVDILSVELVLPLWCFVCKQSSWNFIGALSALLCCSVWKQSSWNFIRVAISALLCCCLKTKQLEFHLHGLQVYFLFCCSVWKQSSGNFICAYTFGHYTQWYKCSVLGFFFFGNHSTFKHP